MQQVPSPESTGITLAAAHDALSDMEETITDLEMYVGLLLNLDDTGGVEVCHIERAADKMQTLIKEVERVRVLAWQATAAGRPA